MVATTVVPRPHGLLISRFGVKFTSHPSCEALSGVFRFSGDHSFWGLGIDSLVLAAGNLFGLAVYRKEQRFKQASFLGAGRGAEPALALFRVLNSGFRCRALSACRGSVCHAQSFQVIPSSSTPKLVEASSSVTCGRQQLPEIGPPEGNPFSCLLFLLRLWLSQHGRAQT